MATETEKKLSFLSDIYLMAPVDDCECLTQIFIDPLTNVLRATGEDTGDEYQLDVESLDMDGYVFYKLTACEYKVDIAAENSV